MNSWLKTMISLIALAPAAFCDTGVVTQHGSIIAMFKTPLSVSTPEPSFTLLIAMGLICFGLIRVFRSHR